MKYFFNTRTILFLSFSKHFISFHNEIPNHSTITVFWCERRDLLCRLSNGDIFTCEDNIPMLFSHVKISSFRARKLTCYFIIVYVINNSILHDIVIIKREQRRKVQNKRKLATTKNCLTLFLIVACEHALWGALAAGREKEGELATASLEFECLHRKR